jgi:hypothetical protein
VFTGRKRKGVLMSAIVKNNKSRKKILELKLLGYYSKQEIAHKLYSCSAIPESKRHLFENPCKTISNQCFYSPKRAIKILSECSKSACFNYKARDFITGKYMPKRCFNG